MSIRTYPVYPQQRYLPTDSTQASLTLTPGRKAVTAGLYLAGSTVHRLVPIDGARGAVLQFFGTDAADKTIAAVAIWVATFTGFDGATYPNLDFSRAAYCDLALFGITGTVTLGTAAGVDSGDLVPATSFIADTIAGWTLGGQAAVTEPAYALGTSDRYSPANNTPASLIIPNFGAHAHAFLVEFDLGTAASANALYTLTA